MSLFSRLFSFGRNAHATVGVTAHQAPTKREISDLNDRYLGAMLGLACGDALGTSVEFQSRGTFLPVTAMRGGGTFELEPGQWTDDTSMALCLAESLITHKAFDPTDQMNRYLKWWRDGYLSPTKYCIDIGTTTKMALITFRDTGIPFSGPHGMYSAGNGSLMRLAPAVMFAYPNSELADRYAADGSRTTHGAEEAIDACRSLACVLYAIFSGATKDTLLASTHQFTYSPKIAQLSTGKFINKRQEEIFGSGYCVLSLEASLWCFFNTDSLADGILRAVNLGDDADTTGAITGQLCGAYYGTRSIPPDWLSKLAMRETIEKMANDLYVISQANVH